jgi:hypothetical protein
MNGQNGFFFGRSPVLPHGASSHPLADRDLSFSESDYTGFGLVCQGSSQGMFPKFVAAYQLSHPNNVDTIFNQA